SRSGPSRPTRLPPPRSRIAGFHRDAPAGHRRGNDMTTKRKKSRPVKKLYTVAEANAALPLVRAIVRDIAQLANDLRQRHERVERLRSSETALSPAEQRELEEIVAEFERGQGQMADYERELRQLGVELKDYFTGLIDFRSVMDGREVYLCWRLGEPEVAHWHELDAGFAGRRNLAMDVAQN